MSLFEKEERIYDEAVRYMSELEGGAVIDPVKYAELLKEYGGLLRRVNTKKSLDTAERYERNFLDEKLQQIMSTLSRSNGRLSVLMLDINCLRECNNKYGRSFGDACIKTVSLTLRNCLKRADDFVARYGGDEFVVVLPSTGEEGARMMANRLFKAIKNIKFPPEMNVPGFSLSISVGATTGIVRHTQQKNEYITRADEALVYAKKSGNWFNYLDLNE